jgi:RHS repeat-associated protein
VSIEYGNGTTTTYGYESETFRLESLKTVRSSDHKILQDIFYIYDPVGNITYIRDNTHRTVFFKQSKVDPVSTYKYDSIYRLKLATGRQHPAINSDEYKNSSAFKQSRYLSFGSVSINDSTALENYSEVYQYDYGGNLEQVIHSVPSNSSRGWTRINRFADDSNRIESGVIGDDKENFTFDPAGNMTKLEHLKEINWNYRNNMSSVVLIKRGHDGTRNDFEYYVYDSHGMRVRKVAERYVKVGDKEFLDIEEKIYLDGYEIKQIKRINLNNKETALNLERYSCHVSDGKKRVVILHKWNVDNKNYETDDLTKTRTHYQLGNHLGSCSLELDGEEQIISYEEYYPYGGTSFITGKSLLSLLPREVSIKEYRYTGKERDDSTGLYYHGARYSVTWLGRWISADPAMLSGLDNVYGYANNNPIVLIDSNGLAPQKLADQYVELNAQKLEIELQLSELEASRLRGQKTLGDLESAMKAEPNNELKKAINEAKQQLNAQAKQRGKLNTQLEKVKISMLEKIIKMQPEEYIIALERTGQKAAAAEYRHEMKKSLGTPEERAEAVQAEHEDWNRKAAAEGITEEKFGEPEAKANVGAKGKEEAQALHQKLVQADRQLRVAKVQAALGV